MSETRLNQRAVIRVSATEAGKEQGEDCRDFLQGLVTQNIASVQEGAPQWAALLSAQGKVLFDFFLWADGDDILIDAEREHAEDLIKRLKLYRLRRKITIEMDLAMTVHWSLDAADQPSDPRFADLGHRWLEAGQNDSLSDNSADEAYRAHRLSLGVTEGQEELGSDKTLWLECNATELNGVSFTKGCYIGQENTARMNYRQKVNRRLVVVPLEQADEKRQRVAYPDLGLSIEHRRVEDLAGLDLPDWIRAALTPLE